MSNQIAGKTKNLMTEGSPSQKCEYQTEVPLSEPKQSEYEKTVGQITSEHTYWDYLAKTSVEKDLLKKIKKNKLGQLCIELYAESGCEGFWEEGDTFGSEVVYRVGYEIGHWYQDREEYERIYQRKIEKGFTPDPKERYPDKITPEDVYYAEMWVREAEMKLNLRHERYF